MRPKLLDLFCGAGGAAMGYYRAGFDVVGVDIKTQKRYPFEFHQADALDFLYCHWEDYDAIHASPPCQRFSVSTRDTSRHADLLTPTRTQLIATGKTYVIENVIGAPLINPIVLCGTMFMLESDCLWLARHRGFESNIYMLLDRHCMCNGRETGQITGHLTSKEQYAKRHRKPSFDRAKRMMDIDWMTKEELVQAIPPAYTEWIGKRLLEQLSVKGAIPRS